MQKSKGRLLPHKEVSSMRLPMIGDLSSPPQSPVSILTNAHPISATGVMERPRKKLSFRDPEVLGSQNTNTWGHLNSLRNHSTTDSIEDVLLESQAMKIVRTVGQAFEVCHKLAPQNVGHTMSDNMSDDCSSQKEVTSELSSGNLGEESTNSSIPVTSKAVTMQQQSTSSANQETQQQPEFRDTPTLARKAQSPLALKHEVLLLKQQLEQQQQQTQTALAEIKLLTGQLAAETTARMEAQARTQQLMVHNKQLLDHIQTLVLQMQELEQRTKPNNQSTQPTLAQLMGLPPLPDAEQLNPPLDVYNAARNLQQQYSILLAQQQSQQNLLPNVFLASLNAASLLPYANHALSDTPSPCYVTPGCRNSQSTFILPLAENDRDSSRDSGLGEVAVDVMRRLDLYSRDSNSNFQNPASARVECADEPGVGGRRNGPFITRSTSEKVPHRNDVLAQVQRTAWARHSTK